MHNRSDQNQRKPGGKNDKFSTLGDGGEQGLIRGTFSSKFVACHCCGEGRLEGEKE